MLTKLLTYFKCSLYLLQTVIHHTIRKKKMTFVSDETPFSLCNVKMHINFEIS